MAIASTAINGFNLGAVKSWMESNLVPVYFAKITGGTNNIVCYRTSDDPLLEINCNSDVSDYAFKIYYEDGRVVTLGAGPILSTNNAGFQTLYMTSNGGVITFSGGTTSYGKGFTLVVTKTSRGKTAMVLGFVEGTQSTNLSYMMLGTLGTGGSLTAAASDDGGSLVHPTWAQVTANQSQLVPFCTDSAIGASSFTPNVYYIPRINGAISSSIGFWFSAALNGYMYLTNGYWAIKDDKVQT